MAKWTLHFTCMPAGSLIPRKVHEVGEVHNAWLGYIMPCRCVPPGYAASWWDAQRQSARMQSMLHGSTSYACMDVQPPQLMWRQLIVQTDQVLTASHSAPRSAAGRAQRHGIPQDLESQLSMPLHNALSPGSIHRGCTGSSIVALLMGLPQFTHQKTASAAMHDVQHQHGHCRWAGAHR